MINPIYNLPEISFVGGESQTFLFNLYTKSGSGYNTDGCDIAFSIVNFANKSNTPILIKSGSTQVGADGVSNTVVIGLEPQDTVGLYGKYIYQLSIRDAAGITEIPGHGIMNITRNIHQSFITNK